MDIREFKNIYKEFTPSVIWDWCAKPTAEEIDFMLYRLSKMGIARIFIRPSKGLVLPYLSEDYFELIRTAARRSGKYGIVLGICDENSPASGCGGGEITSVPDYRIRDVMMVSKKDIEKTDVIISERADDAIVLRDMSRMRASGRMPIADITDAFVTECFTETVYDKYLKQCQRFIGMEIKSFMTQINLPEGVLLYSPTVQKKVRISDAKLLCEKLMQNDKNICIEYNKAFGEAIADNFTGIISEKCRKNNLRLSVSVNGNKTISRQAQYIKADCIAIKFDSETPDFLQIKLAQTVSEQFEKPLYLRLLLPSFAPCSERYNKAAFLTGFGPQGIIFDSMAFSLSDRRKYEKHTVTMSDFTEKDISDRLSRLTFLCSGTNSNTSILVVYNPLYEDALGNLASKLMKQGIGFHMMEESLINKHSLVSGGDLIIGNCRYRTIISCNSSFFVPDGFTGQMITANEYEAEALESLHADCDVIINRRYSEDDEYIFITAEKDSNITAHLGEKKLFAVDSRSGEIYLIPTKDDEYSFKIKSGKTAVLIYSDKLSADIAPPFTDDIEFAPHEKVCDIPFTLSAADENILPLKNVNACFGRKSYRENSIDNLHKEFYRLPDGETVKVKYPFNVDKESIGQVTAYIENADNLEFAELNGKRLNSLTPSEKDPRFMGIDITDMLSDGKNTFAVEYKKSNNYTPDFSSITPSHFYSYNITSFEPIYLCGDFDCDENSLLRLQNYNNDITTSGMAYYYGGLTYAVKLPDKDLSGNILSVEGDFDICKIRIGKRTHTFFCETPMLEVFNLDCGTVAEITVYNTPFNLLRTSKEEAKPFGIKNIELCRFSY